MNRAFLIILIPAVLVAAAYLAFGLRVPWMRAAPLLVLGGVVAWLVRRRRRVATRP